MSPRYQDRPITPTLIEQVKRLADTGYNAEKIAAQVGRSKISIDNIIRLNNIKLGGNKKR